MTGNGSAWKTVAIALLAALLSGSGALVVSAVKRDPVPNLAPVESRLAVQETKMANLEQWMQRIEVNQNQILVELRRQSR